MKEGGNMEQEAKAAAQWWRQFISPLGRLRFDNGDNSQQGVMATVCATMIAQRAQVTEEQADAFAQALERRIREERPRCVSVDYGPDRVLSEAAEEAGVPEASSRLPWKTVMWIEQGLVRVRHGYEAETETLYDASTHPAPPLP